VPLMLHLSSNDVIANIQTLSLSHTHFNFDRQTDIDSVGKMLLRK